MAEEIEQQQQVSGPDGALVMAHVLFLDIVGYSKLSMTRQLSALQQLQTLVQGTQEFGTAEKAAQLLCLPTGDGMALVFFTPTPLTPVKCALELGKALRARAEIALRMGVHSGPVYPHLDIRANENVVGGGINIAQRVMDCGDAGHILLSKAVADVLNQIGGWAESLHDLGVIKVKHKFPVHIFNLYTAGSGNERTPSKCRSGQALKRFALIILVCALLPVLGFIILRLWSAPAKIPAPPRPLRTWAYDRVLVGHTDTVYSVAFSVDDRMVAGGSYDHTVLLWDVQTGAIQRTLMGLDKSLVYTVDLSPLSGNVAAGVGRDVLVWDKKISERPQPLKGHTGLVFGVVFAPDGWTLASCSEDHTVRIWDTHTGQNLRTLAEHTDEVNAVAFSADGKLLASGSYDRTVIIWDVSTWSVKARLTGHGGYVYSVAFTPDGRTLASSSEDGTVRLWDVPSGTLKQTLYQHHGAVNSVAFAPDGETLASAGKDGLVLIWDIRMGALLQTLRRHTNGVTSVAFAHDGRTLASGSKDKTVVLWELQLGGAVLGASRHDAP
jgi:WD40 repeat protein